MPGESCQPGVAASHAAATPMQPSANRPSADGFTGGLVRGNPAVGAWACWFWVVRNRIRHGEVRLPAAEDQQDNGERSPPQVVEGLLGVGGQEGR